MKVKEKAPLAPKIQNIMLQHAMRHLGEAIDEIGHLAKHAKHENVRRLAAADIVRITSMASGDMSEEETEQELLNQIYAANKLATIETDVPDAIRDSMNEAD